MHSQIPPVGEGFGVRFSALIMSVLFVKGKRIVRTFFIAVCLALQCSYGNGQIIISDKLTEQQNVNYASFLRVTPEKPRAGESVRISFLDKGTPLEKSTSVFATAVLYSDKIEDFRSVEMKKNGDAWELDIAVGMNIELIGLMFESDDAVFADIVNGYFIMMHDANGNPTVGAQLARHAAKLDWGPRILNLAISRKPNPDDTKAVEKILADNPQYRAKGMNILLRTTIRNREEKKEKSAIENILEEYRTKFATSEDDYRNLVYGYNIVGNQAKAKEVFAEGAAKFPNGYFGVNTETQKIAQEKDAKKQFDMLEQLLKRFPENPDAERYVATVSHYLMKKNDASSIVEFFSRFKSFITPELASSTAKNIPDDADPKLLALKAELAKYSVELAEREFASPMKKKPEYTSDKTWFRKRRTVMIWNYLTYANIQYEKKNNDEALKYFDKMASLITLESYKDREMMENYSTLLVRAKRFEEAEKIIHHAVKTERFSSGMKQPLRQIYINKYGNEDQYTTFVASLEDKVQARLRADIQPKLIKSAAPQFALMNLDGKRVSLADYRGKIVILDFWATWCGPCLASFPGMQRAVEKFAKDNDVVFLFVNTSEKEADSDKRVAKFIKSKKYPFHVVLDKDYSVRDAYDARSIPNKIFIDKEGNMRYRSVGYSGGPDKLVDEITAIIALLKGASASQTHETESSIN